jgi:DNA adenine methylase
VRQADFAPLAGTIEANEGKFLLSINDVPDVRAAFAWADIEPVNTRYSISKTDAGAARPAIGELLIGKDVNLARAPAQGRLI